MNNGHSPAPVSGALLIGGPKPVPTRLAAFDRTGQAFPLQLGPGLGFIADGHGGVVLAAVKPMTATVVGQKAERQEDGSYTLPPAVLGATPQQISGVAVYSGGWRLAPEKHYTVSGENNILRVTPAAGYLDHFDREDDVLVDYVATY